jgi:cob(I)alamin adenosyltransferase
LAWTAAGDARGDPSGRARVLGRRDRVFAPGRAFSPSIVQSAGLREQRIAGTRSLPVLGQRTRYRRSMSIATKTGDGGQTALMYGRRVPKMDRRVEAYGTVDELNAALGLVRATTKAELIHKTVLAVQKELVILMGELAVADEDRERYQRDGYEIVTTPMVERLTSVVDDLEQNHHISFKRWATPGHTLDAAALDVARTVCRRAERRVVELADGAEYVNPETVRYLNRLSDVLWLFARYAEGESGAQS